MIKSISIFMLNSCTLIVVQVVPSVINGGITALYFILWGKGLKSCGPLRLALTLSLSVSMTCDLLFFSMLTHIYIQQFNYSSAESQVRVSITLLVLSVSPIGISMNFKINKKLRVVSFFSAPSEEFPNQPSKLFRNFHQRENIE